MNPVSLTSDSTFAFPIAASPLSELPQCETCEVRVPPQCRYAGKTCHNLRATKRNGLLHNLCDQHRTRANLDQCRLAHRTRMEQAHAQFVLTARLAARAAFGHNDYATNDTSYPQHWLAYSAAPTVYQEPVQQPHSN